MERLLKLNDRTAIILFILADLFCIGLGMGVPFFCIVFGFPLGWYIARRISLSEKEPRMVYTRILKASLFTTAFTFLTMVIIWGIALIIFFNRTSDYSDFGHPFILYDPFVSFIAWFILMIVISPFLQLLTTIFTSFLVLRGISANEKSA